MAQAMGRSPGNCRATRAGMSCFSTSPQRMSRLSNSPTVSRRMGSSRLSTSTAQTFPARRHSCWVRGPMPGPISSTPQDRSTPACSAMEAGTQGATRKFCPLALEKWKPWAASNGFIT